MEFAAQQVSYKKWALVKGRWLFALILALCVIPSLQKDCRKNATDYKFRHLHLGKAEQWIQDARIIPHNKNSSELLAIFSDRLTLIKFTQQGDEI